MAYLALLEDVAHGRLRRERVFRDQQDLLAYDDQWLVSRFRLPHAVILDLCQALGPALQRSSRRNQAVPVPLQVCTTLALSRGNWLTGRGFHSLPSAELCVRRYHWFVTAVH